DYEDPEPEMLTANAKKFFKLRRDPFENEIACEDDVFLIESHRIILEDMLSAANAGSMIALFGECGSGKTIIRRAFIHQIQQDHPDVILIQPARLDRRKITAESISTAICRALQIKHRPSAEERDAAIEEALIESANNGHLHLMVIDEAHDLNSDVIKLLKRIWELTHGFRRVMGIVLIGQNELQKKLSGQHVREFTWRCNQIRMQPLGMQVPAYIRHKFSRVGINADRIFTEDAMSAIKGKCYARIKHGIALDDVELDRSYPLSINTWLAKAMNLAAQIGEKQITEKLVQRV
ncbi:ExeA family protein, partial [Pseudoalteromonas sp. S16_S37]|uniref:ExeA family protein n=1 Tax=Pseudoalteromonas sp. S16_S37 TaxID=2720228 RepID=UPI001EEF6996